MSQHNLDETRDRSVNETCALLGVTPPTVYKLLAIGKLESYKVGRVRRITGESIALLRTGKTSHGSKPK